jgi:NAD(P)H-hydrate epimerase
MEVAGWQVARCAWQHLGGAAGVSVIAGYGNNGGDGLVAARHLATWGCGVRVLVLGDEARVIGIVADHVLSARNCGVDVVIDASPAAVHGVVAQSELVIDAILGTGLRSAPREPQAEAIRLINELPVPVLSVDVPSGLDATTGEAFDPTVRAALTCTLTAMKRGLGRGDGPRQAGEIWVADIGMPAVAWRQAGLPQPAAVTGGELVHTSS